jgi:hypothetical protein
MRWMFANDPEMAKEWAEHTKDISKLPEKVKKKKAKKKKSSIIIDSILKMAYAFEQIAKLSKNSSI